MKIAYPPPYNDETWNCSVVEQTKRRACFCQGNYAMDYCQNKSYPVQSQTFDTMAGDYECNINISFLMSVVLRGNIPSYSNRQTNPESI